MLKITTVTYRRKFNLGNYESEDIELSGQVEETDDPVEAYQLIKGFVLEMHETPSRHCEHSKTVGTTSGLVCQDCGSLVA